MKFTLLEKSIEISEDRKKYIALYSDCFAMIDKTNTAFIADIVGG